MEKRVPLIDQRTEKEIAGQVRSLLSTYAPAWKEEINPQTQQPQGVSTALINIFARYAALVIQRLNQALDKNFLAFLDLVGAALLPPEPARVPLTFTLAAGSVAEAVVPSGTQAAAPPTAGEKEPVVFETERPLTVTAAQLTSLWVRDPNTDQFADLSASLAAPRQTALPVFQGECPLEHILYIGNDEVLGYPAIDKLTLTLELDFQRNSPQLLERRRVQWETWDGTQWKEIPKASRTDEGILNFTGNGTITITELSQVPQKTINTFPSRWLRARLLTPIIKGVRQKPGTVRASKLLMINKIGLQAEIKRTGLPIEHAFVNSLPVDLSKDFFPFGERPRFGDTLYLANAEVFSQIGATITLNVALTDPAAAGTRVPKDHIATNLALTWEAWNGDAWVVVGTSPRKESDPFSFSDTTQAFTAASTGAVTMLLPKQLAPTTINGITNYWIRVRISAGDYGNEARYEPEYDKSDPPLITGYRLVPATYAPPSIDGITAGYQITKSASPEHILTYNDFKYAAPGVPLTPFKPTLDTHPSLYIGFTLPQNQMRFPNLVLSLYFQLADVLYGQPASNSSPATPPQLAWEYWNGSDWVRLVVNDETGALTHSGLVEILPRADFAPSTEFELTQYWLRVRWDSGNYKFLPRLRTVLLNTTTATQTLTLMNEVLGSSNGGKHQTFRTTRAPVLRGQQLQVREPELPPADESAALAVEEGADAVSLFGDATGRPGEIWVRWRQMMDFYASGPRDRHYVLDPCWLLRSSVLIWTLSRVDSDNDWSCWLLRTSVRFFGAKSFVETFEPGSERLI